MTPPIDELFDLAVQHHKAGGLIEAQALYQQVLDREPRHAAAMHLMGVAAFGEKEYDRAGDLIRRAIALRPTFPEAYNNLGIVLKDSGRLDEAIAAFHQAIAQRPGYATAFINLGNVWRLKNLADQAIDAYRKALAIQPNSPEALLNLGLILNGAQQYDAAIAALRRAIAVRPQFPEAYNGLGLALKDQGRAEEALGALRQALSLRPEYVEAHSNLAFTMLLHPGTDAAAIGAELRRWDRQHAEPLRKFIRPFANDRDAERRLRIGYVSPDFRSHVVGRNISPLLAHHDKSRFEIFAYSNVQLPDARTEMLRAMCDHWFSIFGLTDEQACERIRADRIDILVDLSLHTANHRLLIFARKPAPVQITFAGYPGSTGLGAIDYRLSDPHLDPAGEDESWSSEKIVRLPHSFWCYDPLEERDVPVGPLPAQTAGRITFGCLNQFSKINEPVLGLWAEVMRAAPDSRMLLLAPEGGSRKRAIELFKSQGIASGRIEFSAQQPRRQYLELYHRIDIGLDTFPYNGHTTSLDSFWMGVPVITLRGRTTVGRAGVCQCTNLGLPELIAATSEQFVRVAAALAGDIPRLAALRAGLRQRMEASPLMDARGFAADIEAAYRQMWRAFCASYQP